MSDEDFRRGFDAGHRQVRLDEEAAEASAVGSHAHRSEDGSATATTDTAAEDSTAAANSGARVVTAMACGGKQSRLCLKTGKAHDMSAVIRFRDGGSVACIDCGVTAMEIDLLELP